MIWHIFKKDALLLWPSALALCIAQATGAALVVALGQFHEPRELAVIAVYYPFLVFLGIVVLTIVAVHQEPLSGVRQDWLMRPIFRSDLLLAKALFVILMIHVPIFLVDVSEQLALRFSLIESIAAAASRSGSLLCVLTLPAFLLGAATASLTEALLFALLVGLGCTIIYVGAFMFLMKPPPLSLGVSWIAMASSQVFIVIGAAVTLVFAYSSRRIVTTRIMGVLVVLAAVAILGWFPFEPAFAIQQKALRNQVGKNVIEFRFTASVQKPTLSKVASPISLDKGSRPAPAVGTPIDQLVASSHAAALIRLPLQIFSLPRNSILFGDQVSVRVTDPNGTPLYQGAGLCVRFGTGMGRACRANTFVVFDTLSNADATVEQSLYLPAETFKEFKDRAVTLELDYALTLLRPRPTQTMTTIGDKRQLVGLGSCVTRIDGDGDEIELGCLSTTGPPSCARAVLDDATSGRRNPESIGCRPNYAPFPESDLRDVVNQFGLSLPFRDLSGLARYPIDGTTIRGARVSITAYYPIGHFRRHLVIPDIRLSAWEVTQSQMGAAASRN